MTPDYHLRGLTSFGKGRFTAEGDGSAPLLTHCFVLLLAGVSAGDMVDTDTRGLCSDG